MAVGLPRFSWRVHAGSTHKLGEFFSSFFFFPLLFLSPAQLAHILHYD